MKDNLKSAIRKIGQAYFSKDAKSQVSEEKGLPLGTLPRYSVIRLL